MPIPNSIPSGNSHRGHNSRRHGVRRADGSLDVNLSVPGGARNGTNPERLPAAGSSACSEDAMAFAAKGMHFSLPPELVIDAEVDLAKGDDGCFLCSRLTVHLPGLDSDGARVVVDAAERTCPYSKDLRNNSDIAITLAEGISHE
ncbi:Ohr family peroxiredoxin [Xanthobacteraceae bacterium Astr-EGSB]|uniref:Ohr family peroxiredoxin n=1 Tax=Astrobacterium formosum TaxID=3069710 RepID=UPI0027B79DBF|nr:Ohr family peroxiredoxin [Xanthobacteraceae bacterium Astr-EGSB]